MYRRGIAGMKRVYFMLGDQTDQIKIGMSNDPWERKAEGQIFCPVRLTLLLHTDYTPTCRDLEVYLHNQFAPQRVHGEWFKLTGSLRQFVVDCLGGQNITYPAGPWGSKSQIGFSYRNALALSQLSGERAKG